QVAEQIHLNRQALVLLGGLEGIAPLPLVHHAIEVVAIFQKARHAQFGIGRSMVAQEVFGGFFPHEVLPVVEVGHASDSSTTDRARNSRNPDGWGKVGGSTKRAEAESKTLR